jgi:hypothetical protein
MTWLESIVLATAIAAVIVSALPLTWQYADDETLSIFGATILPVAQCAPHLTRPDISMRCQAHHQSCFPCHQGFANAHDFVVAR